MQDVFNQITATVNSFLPITLKEMDGVALMNRTDTKFTFNISKLQAILEEASAYYKVLEIDNLRGFDYESTYFDTPDHRMFYDQHRGKPNRNKIRRREYMYSGLTFMEVKCKNGQGRTVKERVKMKKDDEHFTTKTSEFIQKVCPFRAHELEPKLVNSFTRYTLVHKYEQERLTIDLNLRFRDEKGGAAGYPFLVIAEVKRDGCASNSTIVQIMKKNTIRATGMSKYCLGIILLNPGLKHNNFKPKLLTLNKIKHDY